MFSGYKLPLEIQWIFALFSVIAGIILSIFLFQTFDLIFWIPLIPVVKALGHFSSTPILRLSGFLHYHSPMLITVKTGNKSYDLHNGTVMDYLFNFDLVKKSTAAKRKIMIQYLKGFLDIINKIENNELPGEICLTGVSYFFSDKTARNLGFEVERARITMKLLNVINVVNLFIMYSLANGRPSIPSIFNLKKAKITGYTLLKSKYKIIGLLDKLEKRGTNCEIKRNES